MNPLKIYDYLVKAREKVFDAVRPLSPEDYSREFPIGLNTIGRTLTHTMIVEWSYVQRILGNSMPPYESWPIQDEKPPAFAVIEKTWREQAPQTRSALEAVDQRGDGAWDREFEFTSFDNTKIITVSPADVFTQLLVHEIHHRAQVMAMLRELGRPLQDLDFGYLMFKRRAVA
jgi:uncharacterized damage-inducible protein DinB